MRNRDGSFTIEQLECRRLLAGVTIVTHGFGLSFPSWVDSMASAMTQRAGTPGVDVSLYKMTVSSSLNVSLQNLSTPLPNSSATGEIVIELDWSALSGLSFTSTTTVATAVVQSLLSPTAATGLGGALAELPFHLVGHSRGASLVTELARQLGAKGIWVDQVTSLDPHPTSGDAASPDDSSTVALYDNVVFGDNYYRDEEDTLFDPGGHNVRGAVSFHLNGIVTTTSQSAHSNVHTYYHGTVDTSTSGNSGIGTISPNWYTAPYGPRQSVGYAWSRIAGGTRPALGMGTPFGGTGDRYPVTVGAQAWPNVGFINKTQPGTQFTIGQPLDTTFKIQDHDSPANVYLYLDRDRNPYNGNFAAADPAHSIAGDSLARGQFSSTFTNVADGGTQLYTGGNLLTGANYYICARITDGTHQRFAYLSIPLTFAAPSPAFSVNDASCLEGDSGFTDAMFTVSIATAWNVPLTVDYATSNGTAEAGVDYAGVNGTLTFAPGETTKTINVPILGDLIGEPDETFALNLSNAVGTTIARAQGIGTIIDDGPKITSSQFDYESGQTVSVTFSKDLGLVPVPSALSVQNLFSGAVFAASGTSYASGNRTETFAFSQILPDGNYACTLSHGSATDIPGNPLASDFSFNFFVLGGDANRDRVVNTIDFTMLATHFGQNGMTFSKGDFNYDGKVNALDFNALASRYGMHLAPAQALAESTSVVAPAANAPRSLFSDIGIRDENLLAVL